MPGRGTLHCICYVGLYRPSFLDSSCNAALRCTLDFRCYVSTETCLLCTTKRRTEKVNEQIVETVPAPATARNPGKSLDLDWVRQVRVNRSAVERRAATIPTRRTVKQEWQAAWLLRAITCIDLTTLQGDDSEERVRRLCAKARQPMQPELV